MVTKKIVKKTKAPVKEVKPERYFESVGGRKTAHARVRLYTKVAGVVVNNKDYKEYFKTTKHQDVVMSPFKLMNADKLGATIKVAGGGINAQAGAVRHGIASALVKFNETFKKRLRAAGFLTRDPRHVERKKYGLKKARRAPQWAKR